ncbi:MAG: aldehyde dehydrogenase family protein, partial [Paraglaciecola sp.]|nr:aldehyde dehydrogenase family protein [Paraglaciecola sp.]
MTNRFNVNGVMVSGDHFIDGARVASADTFETRSPMDWDNVLGHVARGTKETAELAIVSATNAFPQWSALSAKERAV